MQIQFQNTQSAKYNTDQGTAKSNSSNSATQQTLPSLSNQLSIINRTANTTTSRWQ